MSEQSSSKCFNKVFLKKVKYMKLILYSVITNYVFSKLKINKIYINILRYYYLKKILLLLILSCIFFSKMDNCDFLLSILTLFIDLYLNYTTKIIYCAYQYL